MKRDIAELKKLRSETGAKVTRIAFEANLNPDTVYEVLRGKASLNSYERVRKILRYFKECQDSDSKAAG